MRKQIAICLTVLALSLIATGCSSIENMEPRTGPAGTPVKLETGVVYGDPLKTKVLVDGVVVCEPFSGTFMIPKDCEPGKHKVTFVDILDPTETWLMYPLPRLRSASTTFIVTE